MKAFAYRAFTAFVAAQALCQVACASTAADKLLDSQGEIWQLAPDQFMTAHEDAGFSWTSDKKDMAKAARKEIMFLDEPVLESSAQFKDGYLNRLSFLLYSRGDSGDMGKDAFLEMWTSLQTRITAWTQAKSSPGKNQMKTRGVKRKAEVWIAKPHAVELVCSYSTEDAHGRRGFRAEYVRVEFSPHRSGGIRTLGRSSRSTRESKSVSMSALVACLKKETNGDVFIDGIPMVDQGQKGYCAVATAERVFRHYGLEVDQHEMAQLASSSASAGTSPSIMMNSLKRVGVKLGCDLRIHESFDTKGFLKLVQNYNRQAKREKEPGIMLGRMISAAFVYQQMDTEILRRVRTKSRGSLTKFMKTITKHVDQGTPLAWGLILGKVPETPPVPAPGGHMRLIIGYNKKTSEVLYTDSWGPGHEFKRMSLADAWTVTVGLYSIEPRYKTR